MAAAKKPADKAALLAPRFTEGEVEIEGFGTVKVRGMSRGEFLAVQKFSSEPLDADAQVIAWCMVEPAMNKGEAVQWINASPPTEIAPVIAKVWELSGLADDEGKASTKG